MMNNKEINTINWIFPSFPSENFKQQFNQGLLEYIQGTKSFDDVVNIVKEAWASEKAK